MKRQGDSRFTEARDRLTAAGERMRERLAGMDEQADVDRILADLRESRFDVAVIGQIKAGKSTFLNALMERPDLLPTNVSPWTAVITRLHFGRTDEAEGSAQFHFYTREQFDRLREAQLEAEEGTSVKRRVVDVRHLLGQTHRVERLEPRTLEMYLAMGGDPSKPDAGRYAAITREADLVLAQRPFAQPCTVVDTVGTNEPDPFRDRITLDYVADAHAYVMVLNAAQPMTRSDLDFLKNIRIALRRERLAIFLNRVDRLERPVRDLPKVRNRVRRILEDELPGAEVPLLAGCAYWGNIACRRDPLLLKSLLYNSKFEAVALADGIPRARLESWRRAPEQNSEAIRTAVLSVSGIHAARELIANILLREAGLSVLETARERLRAQAGKAAATLEGRMRDEQELARSLEEGHEQVQARLRALDERISGLEKYGEVVEAILELAAGELGTLARGEAQELERALLEVVERFAATHEERLRAGGAGLRAARRWDVDLTPCLEELRSRFDERLDGARQRLAAAQGEFHGVLREKLEALDPRAAAELRVAPAAPVDASAATAMLGRTTGVDLGGWWKRLRSTHETVGEAATRLGRSIRDELEPLARELASAASSALHAGVESTSEVFREAAGRGVRSARREVEAGRRTAQELAAQDDPQDVQEGIFAAMRRAVQARTHAEELHALELELAALDLPHTGALGPGGGA